MLNALYGTFFGRLDPRRSEPVSVVIGLVVLTVLAFNAAATTDTGIGGVLGFGCLFFMRAYSVGYGWGRYCTCLPSCRVGQEQLAKLWGR